MRSFTIQSVSLVILRNHPDVSFRRGLKLQVEFQGTKIFLGGLQPLYSVSMSD